MPLSPDGSWDPFAEHRCTSVLVWPGGERPRPENSLVTDPCFTNEGLREALETLASLNLTFQEIGYGFVTHMHGDHCLNVPAGMQARIEVFDGRGPMSDIRRASCPGHAMDLEALAFRTNENEELWIAGDAILNEAWLRAWEFYWPNGYLPAEIVNTWQSVARILSSADIVVPGHGPAFRVTRELLENIAKDFPHALRAQECPEVQTLLRKRCEEMRSPRRE